MLTRRQSLNLAWLPRVDGQFLTDNPQQLILAGKVANVPFVTGVCRSTDPALAASNLYMMQDVDDEGTLFSLGLLDIT